MAFTTFEVVKGKKVQVKCPDYVDDKELNLTENALKVLERRYVRRDVSGVPLETPAGMFYRVARHVSENGDNELQKVDEVTRQYYELLTEKRFYPNSPTFTGAATPLGQLAACFVLKVEDDMGGNPEGIFSTLRNAALIQQTGGGNGFSFGRLRPRGDSVASSNGKATGPVGFMKVYDSAFGEVSQGGVRRSANMAVLPVNHPDIEEFVECKAREGDLSNFNISVAITDEFMRAVMEDDNFWLVNPRDGKPVRVINAKQLFNKIVKYAYRNGEPGLLFIDAANRSNPVPHRYELEATNPCFAPGTFIHTKEGHVAIEKLVGKTVDVWDGDQWVSVNNFRVTAENQRTLIVTMGNGKAIVVTPYHKMVLASGREVRASTLMVSDELLVSNAPGARAMSGNDNVIAHIRDGRTEEKVYCCTVDTTHRLALSCGIITGQCGEQWLGPYENCCLGSVNLAQHWYCVDGKPVVDWERLEETIRLSTRFLDDVVSANAYVPSVPQVKEAALRARRIGLGIMGLADMMYALGIRYGSEEGQEFAAQIMEFVRFHCMYQSITLSVERGPFLAFKGSIYDPEQEGGMKWRIPVALSPYQRDYGRPYLDWPMIMRDINRHGIRNAAQTTVAPTGTIATVCGCEGYGCEPVFALGYTRHFKDGDKDVELSYTSPLFEAALDSCTSITPSGKKDILSYVLAYGTLDGCPTGMPPEIRRTFAVSSDILPEEHVGMQAAIQAFVDNSISKCLAEGTLIQTDRGLVAIEDFSSNEQPGEFYPVHGINTSAGDPITAHYCAGNQLATKVRLSNGAEIVGATLSHRIMTTDGWKLLSELKKGDSVVGRFSESHGVGGMEIVWHDSVLTNGNDVSTPKAMSGELAKFLGMICADGHLQESSGLVSITKNETSVLCEFSRLTKSLFGVEAKFTTDKRNGVTSAHITSRNLVRYLTSLIGNRAANKHAPYQILQGSKYEKSEFLSGLTLDGYFKQRCGLVVYEGRSEKLAYQAFEMCNSFGLPKVYAFNKPVPKYGGKVYGVLVSNEMQSIVTPIELHKRQPTQWGRYRVQIAESSIESAKVLADADGYSNWRMLNQRKPSFCWNTTALQLGIEALAPVYAVQSVEDAGMVPMYDVEVIGTHSYVTNGIVSHNTCNFGPDATEQDVADAYMLAWELGCKGLTVYVTGSRDKVVLETAATKAKKETIDLKIEENIGKILKNIRASDTPNASESNPVPVAKRPRPSRLTGATYRKETPLGKAYVTINDDENGDPFEVFLNVGKAGSETDAISEGLGRLISLVLRISDDVSPHERLRQVMDELKGIGGGRSMGFGPNRVRSLPDGIAQVLGDHLGSFGEMLSAGIDKEGLGKIKNALALGELCPECGEATLLNIEGCRKCQACGYSEC